MANNFRVKMAKSVDLPLIVALAFLNGVKHRNSDSKRFICDDLATLCRNLVNISPVTPEFKKGKDVCTLRSAVRLRGATARYCGISSEFSGEITAQFSFTYTLEDVTAMPRGLHATHFLFAITSGSTELSI